MREQARTQVSKMKPKLLACLIIGLFLAIPSMPLAYAIPSHSLALPSNTILFDDMETTGCTRVTNSSFACDNWFVYDGYPNKLSPSFQCGTPVARPGTAQINNTVGPWIMEGTGALQVQCGTNTVTQDARKAIYWGSGDTVGFAGWFAVNCNIAAPGAGIGATVDMSLEYWDSNQHRHEGKLQLNINGNNPTFSNWKYDHDSSVFSTIVMGAGQFPDYPGWDCLGHISPGGRNNHAWMPFKIVVNRTTGKYVSITTPEGTWTCTGNGGLNNGCLVNDDGVDTASIPAGVTSTVWDLEIQLDTGSISPAQNPQYWAVALDNVLVTDETPGGPPIIQFGVTLFSAWFPILVASIAMLYTTSGIGLIRRVWFNKTEGILSSYKTIVATGLIATIGFIVILVIGALLTQQVCSTLPQGTARCSF